MCGETKTAEFIVAAKPVLPVLSNFLCGKTKDCRFRRPAFPDVDDSQDLMRQELEKYEQLNKVDKGRFVFDFKIINPE